MSIAQMAANIKQRQKIAHASSYMQRIQDARKGTVPAEINTKTQTCNSCGNKTYYKWLRCPACESGKE